MLADGDRQSPAVTLFTVPQGRPSKCRNTRKEGEECHDCVGKALWISEEAKILLNVGESEKASWRWRWHLPWVFLDGLDLVKEELLR